jgi:hypothetical protein
MDDSTSFWHQNKGTVPGIDLCEEQRLSKRILVTISFRSPPLSRVILDIFPQTLQMSQKCNGHHYLSSCLCYISLDSTKHDNTWKLSIWVTGDHQGIYIHAVTVNPQTYPRQSNILIVKHSTQLKVVGLTDRSLSLPYPNSSCVQYSKHQLLSCKTTETKTWLILVNAWRGSQMEGPRISCISNTQPDRYIIRL